MTNLEALPDISPQTRQELTSQIRASIQVASRREASFLESQRNLEQVAQGAASSQRMLQDRVRREATLKVLSQQMNALVDEERYAEAQNVSVDFAEDAGITITKDSIEGQHFVEEPLMLEMYAHDKKLKVLRERAFVDAMALVLKSNRGAAPRKHIVWVHIVIKKFNSTIWIQNCLKRQPGVSRCVVIPVRHIFPLDNDAL